METHAYVYVFLLVGNICNRREHQYPEDIIERQPEVIKREKYCDQNWREPFLNAEMRCQITSEEQLLSQRSKDHIEDSIVRMT